jgi:hypothetical protein
MGLGMSWPERAGAIDPMRATKRAAATVTQERFM